MSAVCACGCGRSRSQRRLGPSRYEIRLGGRAVGTVRKDVERWTNSVSPEWSRTRGEAIDVVLRRAHNVLDGAL